MFLQPVISVCRPEMEHKTVCLHYYQEDIIQRLSEEWRTHRSVMVQMPTGTGKTHVLAAVVSSFLTDGKRTVWIVAHRRELVEQIEKTVAKYGTSLTDGCVRVMSIQWLTRHYDDVVEKPELVIIDEAHHAQDLPDAVELVSGSKISRTYRYSLPDGTHQVHGPFRLAGMLMECGGVYKERVAVVI